MSETTNEAEAQDTPNLTETVEHPTKAEAAAEDDGKPGREAARYRRQLREAETERDGLRTQLDALRRAEVDRLVTDAKLKPAAVWAAGIDLASLLAADGTVDPAKVAQAVTTTREVFGIAPLRVAPSAYGQGNVGVPVGSGAEKGWQGAFAPRGGVA